MFTYRISKNTITVILDNRARVVQKTHMNFEKVKEELKKDQPCLDTLKDLVDIPSFIAKVTHGKVQISNDEVRYDGKPAHAVIATRILEHMAEGLSVTPLANFLNRLMENPNESVRKDLFEWIEAGDMPFTPDGWVVAYKKVRDDYYSYHKDGKGRTFFHHPGTVLEMPREDCNEDRTATCSTGLHFCSYGYLKSYHGSTGRVVIVAIDPADVTAIPRDYNLQKGRCCRYTVIGEVPEDEAKLVFGGSTKLIVEKQHFGIESYHEQEEMVGKDIEDNDPDLDEDMPLEGFSDDEEGADEPIAVMDIETSGDAGKPSTSMKVSEKATKGKKFLLKKTGTTFTEKKLKKMLAKKSQREVSKETGIPRSTLQAWISQFSPEGS